MKCSICFYKTCEVSSEVSTSLVSASSTTDDVTSTTDDTTVPEPVEGTTIEDDKQ